MKVVGLYLVRNEVDVMEANLRHHLGSVIDEAVVIDNGSTDGTLQLLADLADELPIALASEVGHYYQEDRVTRLARFATARGADWVLPIDADEFWVGEGVPFRQVLAEAPADARALFAEVVNFVQRRDVLLARPGCLASMTMRPPHAYGPPELCSKLVWAEEIGWVEAAYTPKCVHRAAPDIVVPKGNHLTGVTGGVPTDRIVCLHAPFRALSIMTAKVDHGRRAVEEGGPAGAAWQVKRWWEQARTGTLDREWAALSFEDDAIVVGGRRRELVADDRLRRVAEAVAPQVRTTAAQVAQPTDSMSPGLGAYLLALDTVPGWLSPLDFRVFAAFDRIQRAHGIDGDAFEIGAYLGKSAILLGHLVRAPSERLTVCDVFEHAELVDAESFLQYNHWYGDGSEKAFLAQYGRFHERPPDVVVWPSEALDAAAYADTCRLVHADGSHRYDIVRHDVATSRALLRPGGVAAFGGLATVHSPGAALAVWELVLGGDFVPLCLTEAKLFGVWDPGGVAWVEQIAEWVEREPDLGSETHTLAGWPVRRLFANARPAPPRDRLVRIPDLDGRMPSP